MLYPSLNLCCHKTVNFFILPLFVIANTAIIIPHNIINALNSTIGIGVIAGLVIGKPIGIFIFSRMMLSLKIAKLPTNTNLRQLLGMGSLAGIGFTMSIFTTSLAFQEEQYKDIAKIAILTQPYFIHDHQLGIFYCAGEKNSSTRIQKVADSIFSQTNGQLEMHLKFIKKFREYFVYSLLLKIENGCRQY